MTFNLSKKLIILTLIISAATLNAGDSQKPETIYSQTKTFVKNNKKRIMIGSIAAAICGLEIYGTKEIIRLSALPEFRWPNMSKFRKYADGWLFGAAFLAYKFNYPNLAGNIFLAEKHFARTVSKVFSNIF